MRWQWLFAIFGLSIFGAIVFTTLAAISLVLVVVFADVGQNTVVREEGERVAHFGVPFTFATENSQLAPPLLIALARRSIRGRLLHPSARPS